MKQEVAVSVESDQDCPLRDVRRRAVLRPGNMNGAKLSSTKKSRKETAAIPSGLDTFRRATQPEPVPDRASVPTTTVPNVMNRSGHTGNGPGRNHATNTEPCQRVSGEQQAKPNHAHQATRKTGRSLRMEALPNAAHAQDATVHDHGVGISPGNTKSAAC